MATFKFLAIGTKSPVKVYVRFSNGRKCTYKKPTELLIDPKNWDAKNGKVRERKVFPGKTKLQNDLADLKNHLIKRFNDDQPQGTVFSGEWLREEIDDHFHRPNETNQDLLLAQVQAYLDYLPTKEVDYNDTTKRISQSRIRHFKSLYNNIVKFEKAKRKHYLLSEVGKNFRDAYKNHAHDKQGRNFNSIGTDLSQIKTVCLWANKKGMNIHSDVLNGNFKPTKEPVIFVTLTPEEIERIKNHDFRTSPYLDNARNWMVIGCWIGARGSDLLHLTMDNIKDGYIQYTAHKTNQDIIVGLHPDVEEIIEKLGGFPNKISNQRLNDYIKLVCKEVGITEKVKGSKMNKESKRKVKGTYPKYQLITSHCFRRSFATNHYGKLPTPVLMAITGHKTEKMFLKYIGKTAKDSADVLKEYWEELRKNPTGKVVPLKKAN
ncbi:MAG: hypothetical protein GY751_25560 [Bacteroidetes bacterium]|nr:hypothetical protein [Bacteroidota bacterium]